jgi:sialate O-acetylesterase
MEASTTSEEFAINETVWSDVLVGEVWFGSGQSNIFLPAKSGYFTEDARLHAMVGEETPHLRLLDRRENWRVGGKEDFSAQLYAFGHMLQKELGVPVGLMVFAQGGSATKPWLNNEMLLADPEVAAITAELVERYPNAVAAFERLQEEKSPGWRSYKAPKNPDLSLDQESGSKEYLGKFWDQYISHYAGYAVRGIYWDQGESMSGIPYLDLPTTTRCLINGWRAAWGQERLPFILVQKPSGGSPAFDAQRTMNQGSKPFKIDHHPKRLKGRPSAISFFRYDGAPIRLMELPDVHMLSSADLCTGLHPWNKSGYAERGLDVALKLVYGQRSGPAYGPRYASHEIVDQTIVIRFTDVGNGLAFQHHDEVLGFYIAGADGRYVAATAVIEGETVVCSAPGISEPKHVLYGLFSRRTGTKEAAAKGLQAYLNFYNAEGLPAIPFTTEPLDGYSGALKVRWADSRE